MSLFFSFLFYNIWYNKTESGEKMKDYSEYFKGPSLRDAKHRGKDEIHHIDDAYEVPADMIGIGKGQKYFIQTYGCQAN